MQVFTPIRTRRLNVRLQEMSIGDSMAMCAMRPDMPEAGTSELLRKIVEDDNKPRPGQVTDTRLWTVQERALVVAHYIAATGDDPDFAIGEKANFSDYLMEGADFAQDEIDLGDFEDDHVRLRPLLGMHAEAIERLITTEQIDAKRAGWWLGAMAVQIVTSKLEPIDVENISDAELDEIIVARVQALKSSPERTFMQLLYLFLDGQSRLNHLFRLEFLESGIAFMPKESEAGLSPATFPFVSAISDGAKQAFGNA